MKSVKRSADSTDSRKRVAPDKSYNSFKIKTNTSTNSDDNTETNEIVELVKLDLTQCINEGVKHYKSLMDPLLGLKQALKNSEMQDYHNKHLEIIKKAMSTAYEDITTTANYDTDIKSEIEQILTQAQARLTILINKQLHEIYLRKHEIQIDSVVKSVKKFTNQAEMVYDEAAETCHLPAESRRQAKMYHTVWAEEAVNSFHQLLQQNKIQNNEFWLYELQYVLSERLEDMLEEIPDEEPMEQHANVEVDSSTSSSPDLSTVSDSDGEKYTAMSNSPSPSPPRTPPLTKPIFSPTFSLTPLKPIIYYNNIKVPVENSKEITYARMPMMECEPVSPAIAKEIAIPETSNKVQTTLFDKTVEVELIKHIIQKNKHTDISVPVKPPPPQAVKRDNGNEKLKLTTMPLSPVSTSTESETPKASPRMAKMQSLSNMTESAPPSPLKLRTAIKYPLLSPVTSFEPIKTNTTSTISNSVPTTTAISKLGEPAAIKVSTVPTITTNTRANVIEPLVMPSFTSTPAGLRKASSSAPLYAPLLSPSRHPTQFKSVSPATPWNQIDTDTDCINLNPRPDSARYRHHNQNDFAESDFPQSDAGAGRLANKMYAKMSNKPHSRADSADIPFIKMHAVMQDYSGKNNYRNTESLQSQSLQDHMAAAKLIASNLQPSPASPALPVATRYSPTLHFNMSPNILHNNNQHYYQQHLQPMKIDPVNKITMDIGIYFDQSWFKVGVLQNTKPFQELISVTPEMYFSEEGITIGEEASRMHMHHSAYGSSSYFNVFQLTQRNDFPSAKSNSQSVSVHQTLNHFCVGKEKYIFCAHQIIAAFLQTLLRQIEVRCNAEIGTIIMTIPFRPTSGAKEKLKRAARIAGYEDIRILSTIITCGISSIEIFRYHQHQYQELDQGQDWQKLFHPKKENSLPPKHVFILDFKKSSFSMGIVKISSNMICVENPYGSDNMIECQQDWFLQSQASLYEGRDIDPSHKHDVLQVYKKAIHHVFGHDRTRNFPVDRIFVSEDRFGILLEEIVHNTILKGNVTVFNSTLGPLLGASLLASNSNLNSRNETILMLPKNIRVHDSSRCNLVLTLTVNSTETRECFTLMNTKFMDRCIFEKRFYLYISLDNNNNIQRTVNCILQLEELYDGGNSNGLGNYQSMIEACRYQLTFKSDPVSSNTETATDNSIGRSTRMPEAGKSVSDKKVYFDIKCWVDDDGVYCLTAECFPLMFHPEMSRVDNVTCRGACEYPLSREYKKLMEFYEEKQTGLRGTIV